MTRPGPNPLSEHPFELLFGILAVVGGAAAAFGVVSPTSINAVLPLAVVRAWGVLQMAAGLSMATGIFLASRHGSLLLGWRLERAGLWPLAVTLVIYAAVAFAYSGSKAIYPASWYLVFAAACIARASAVARFERTVRRHLPHPPST